MMTYKKIKGTLDPKTQIKITGDKPDISEEINDETTNPVIKYLSNIKDPKTGSVSKPFTINNKKYQMVRGITPTKEVVMCVYCHDDLDESGDNIIHSVDHFDNTIAKPFLKETSNTEQLTEEPINSEKPSANDSFIKSINLLDLQGYKHFFVNTTTGEIKAKFKTTKDMIKSGIKLETDEDYMDIKNLKKFRFSKFFKSDVNEKNNTTEDSVNTTKLQTDVKKLTTLIQNKFGNYLSKLDKPIEQAQFLTAMASEIGVPLNKLSTIINNFKDIAKTESRIITKKELIESLIK